ncbi:MAG TPA: DNA-binding domain-containing protein [Candidatus Sulfotelmatobacter sp.]|nr:DNA-binding domain-containing protein [Candidatus Sulfotelmatobacter sp.]
MKLHTLQRAVARAVMQPLTRSERMQRKAPGGGRMSVYAARYIKPNDRLTSFERLEIYNRQYWFRVLGSLTEDFPGLRAVLGGRRFEAMCRVYLADCPSRSFTLRNLGSQLENWLGRNPRWIRERRVLALDMVRLEWADIEAFDSQAKPALRAEDVRELNAANLRLSIQPYVQLLELHYPVDDLLLEVKHGDEAQDFASNAVQERKKRSKVRAVAKLKPAKIFLAVHRLDFSVYFRRIEPEEFTLLGALRSGKTIERAIGLAFRKSSVPAADRAAFVQHSFQTWAALGWFCRPGENVRGKEAVEKRA